MTGIDWMSVDAAAQRTIDQDHMATAIENGLSQGGALFQRRLMLKWVLATVLVLALTVAAFVARGALHGGQIASASAALTLSPARGASPTPNASPTHGASPAHGASPTSGASPTHGASPAPIVLGVDPSRGPANRHTPVTINGTGFTGATAVRFGSQTASNFTVDSATRISATSPPGVGTVDVTVTTPAGSSPAGAPTARYTYADVSPAPIVLGVSPHQGPAQARTGVTITGTGFTGATTVSFGSNTTTSFVVDSDTQISVESPPGSSIVDVSVTTPAGTSATGASSDRYTYTNAPPPSIVNAPAPSIVKGSGTPTPP